jgi:RND family efflux transporter MFP subunit
MKQGERRRRGARVGEILRAGGAWLLVPGLLLAVLVSAAGAASPADGVEAVTKANDDVILAFPQPGRISKILVKEGDAVKAGQPLVQLDDDAEKLMVAQLEHQAKDDVRVRAAKQQLAAKKVDLDKLKGAVPAVKEWDIRHAELDVIIAELSLELAKFEHEQDLLKYREAKARLDRMVMQSPIDGRVEHLFRQAGEGTEAMKDVIRVVNVDPLRIDTPAPIRIAREVKLGQAVRVRVVETAAGRKPGVAEVQPKPVEMTGKVTHIGAVADPGSDTLTVRVEVPNPAGQQAGERVLVFFAPEADKDK